MQASEIDSKETLEAWLNARPKAARQREAVLLAHRAAMRVLPFYLRALREPWARKEDLTALPVLRASLTSGNPLPEVKEAFAAAARTAFAAAADDAAFAAAAADDAADAAAAAAADDVFGADAFAADDAWWTLRADADAIEAGTLPLTAALWSEIPPYRFAPAWNEARDWLTANPGHAFWLRWYEAALAGQPLTGDWESHWKLLTEIALIPEDDWEKGAEHVGLLIEKIEERYRLLDEVRRLKGELSAIAEQASGISRQHNHPPEPIEDSPPAQQVLIVWGALEEAEAELEKPEPDASVLKKVADVLLQAAMAIGKYCAGLADTAAQSAANELGVSGAKWALRIGAGAFAAKMLGLDDAIRMLAEGLVRFAGG